MAFQNNRRMNIRIYFKDSPSPIDVTNVCHMGTEGGLLRIVTDGGHDHGGETQWWPLIHVFSVRLLSRSELAIKAP